VEPKAKRRIVLIAEFSIHHIGAGTSVGRYVKAAVRAMSRIPGLTFDIAPMSSVLEAENIGTILEAVEVSHRKLPSIEAFSRRENKISAPLFFRGLSPAGSVLGELSVLTRRIERSTVFPEWKSGV